MPQSYKKIPTFGARITPEYKAAEKILRKWSNKGYTSATYLEDVRFKRSQFPNDYFKGLVALKCAETSVLVGLYRKFISGKILCTSMQDCFEKLKEMLNKTKVLNCGECGFIIHNELNKLGIPNRIVFDETIDHIFIIANSSKPFNSYRDREKGAFVVDLWLKKIYPSIQEAYLDFMKRFEADIDDTIIDGTNINRIYKFKEKTILNDSDEFSNQVEINDLLNYIKKIKNQSSYETLLLKKKTNHVAGKKLPRLKRDYREILAESLQR